MIRIAFRAALLLPAVVVSLSAIAGLEDLDYKRLNPPRPTADSDRIVVTEFFSYQCPHCNAFDPVLHDWIDELPGDVLFERVPISIGYPAWSPIAQAAYALQVMGKLDSLHTAIFRAIHAEGERLFDKPSIVQWIRKQGIDQKKFSELYDSFGISSLVSRAEQLAGAYTVFSVPSLAIDGKYLIAIYDTGDSERYSAFRRQLEGAGELIERIRAEKLR